MFLSTIGRISINQIFNLGPQKFSKKFRSLIFMVSRVVCKESHLCIRFLVMYPIYVGAYPCQSIPRPEQDPCQSIPRPEQHPYQSNIHAGAIPIPEQPHAGAIPMQEHTITNVGTYPCRIIPRRELYQCLSLPIICLSIRIHTLLLQKSKWQKTFSQSKTYYTIIAKANRLPQIPVAAMQPNGLPCCFQNLSFLPSHHAFVCWLISSQSAINSIWYYGRYNTL